MIALQYLRSLIFVVQMYVMMLLAGICVLPAALISRERALRGVKWYCNYVRWSVRVICGLKTVVRGEVPEGDVIIASKHQSFFDIIMLISALPQPRYVMKASLKKVPVLGWYAMRIGCIPVDRSRRAAALHDMVHEVTEGEIRGGQLVIFPQGTRVAPGAREKYKAGVVAIYEQTNEPCVPVAVNVGLFWPRQGLLRRSGTAVVEFLDPIAPGLPRAEFRPLLERTIETASNRLMVEEGFPAHELPDVD